MIKKKDNLEKFIEDHRALFDDERPSLKVWATIEKQIRPERRSRRIWRWSVAASVLLIVGMGLGFVVTQKLASYQAMQAFSQSEEYQGVHQYFETEVKALAVQLHGDPSLAEIQPELEKIDKQIEELKKDLIRVPTKSKEIIFNAIIASYESKVELLMTAIESRNEFIQIDKNESYEL